MKKIILSLFFCSLFISCSTSSSSESTLNPITGAPNPPTSGFSEWSIPINEVLDGGPGRDGIPALEGPSFTGIANITYMRDEDLILGFKKGNDVRGYPHAILDWHEIINDDIGDVSVAVNYCPLTGTGIGWNRVINGSKTTFGVSGLLFNTNLIPFDRATRSNWAQILNEAVNGPLLGQKADLIMLFETNWKTWKELYPNSVVLGLNTGFSRTYGTSPYGDYNTNNDRFLFPVAKDGRLPSKEKVLAILDGSDAKAYRFASFPVGGNLKFDSFKGKNYIIVGNANFIVAFERTAETSGLEFEYISNGTEIILGDNEGNEWNVFGEALSGPRQGQFLKPAEYMMAMWFSIPAFYNTEIFQN